MKLKKIHKIEKKSHSGKVYDLAVDDNFIQYKWGNCP
jgi:hypothetical protein